MKVLKYIYSVSIELTHSSFKVTFLTSKKQLENMGLQHQLESTGVYRENEGSFPKEGSILLAHWGGRGVSQGRDRVRDVKPLLADLAHCQEGLLLQLAWEGG